MIDTNLEMMDKIGYLLFKKGIIDAVMLEKALNTKMNDKSKIKRNLAQVLVQDFGYDHDLFTKIRIDQTNDQWNWRNIKGADTGT